MIKLKAAFKGVPFTLEINGKQVIHFGFNEKGKWIKTQWFPPMDKKVMGNLPREEYIQWSLAKNEEEVYNLIKIDLIKNQCIITDEERN